MLSWDGLPQPQKDWYSYRTAKPSKPFSNCIRQGLILGLCAALYLISMTIFGWYLGVF